VREMTTTQPYPSPPAPPSKEEIRAQLADIEKSSIIPPTPLRILQFAIDENLAGREVKELTILLHLGRAIPAEGEDDPTVRVQARTLRRKLEEYYRTEGWHARVDIKMPKGGYNLTFSRRKEEDQLSAAAEAALGCAQAASDKQTFPACAEALGYLDEILAKHKDYSIALALKADVHIIRAMQGLPPKAEVDAAMASATRALEISPGLWQAHNSYGGVQSVLRNWSEAHKAFKRARQLTPPNVPVHFLYTGYLVARGQLDKAIRLTEKAANGVMGYYGRPTLASPVIRADLGFLHLLAGDLEKAKTTLESTIHDSPTDFYMPHIYLALVYEAQDDPKTGAAVVDAILISPEQSALVWGGKALLNGLAGDHQRASSELAKLLAVSAAGHYVPPFQFAIAYIGLGDHQKALESLRLIDDCDPVIYWLRYLPFLRHLAHLPDFHAFLNKTLNLKWKWKRRG
jgi:tetratricopeptide (TPR) repeat protein